MEYLYRNTSQDWLIRLLKNRTISSLERDYISFSKDPKSGGQDYYGSIHIIFNRKRIESEGAIEVLYDDPEFWEEYKDVAKHVTGYYDAEEYYNNKGYSGPEEAIADQEMTWEHYCESFENEEEICLHGELIYTKDLIIKVIIDEEKPKEELFELLKENNIKYTKEPATMENTYKYIKKNFLKINETHEEENFSHEETIILDESNTATAPTTKLDPKAEKFLDAVRISDRSIQLKDLSVEASPKGNWVVYYKGQNLMTVNRNMLDDATIQKYELERHPSFAQNVNKQTFMDPAEKFVAGAEFVFDHPTSYRDDKDIEIFVNNTDKWRVVSQNDIWLTCLNTNTQKSFNFDIDDIFDDVDFISIGETKIASNESMDEVDKKYSKIWNGLAEKNRKKVISTGFPKGRHTDWILTSNFEEIDKDGYGTAIINAIKKLELDINPLDESANAEDIKNILRKYNTFLKKTKVVGEREDTENWIHLFINEN